MLSSDWLMKEVFFLPILSFFGFFLIAGLFVPRNPLYRGICLSKYHGTIGKYSARGEIPSLNS